MGLQPEPSYLIFHKIFEHKEISGSSYKTLFSLLDELGRRDPEFINSLVIIITPYPDPNSDMVISDLIYCKMTTVIGGLTREQNMTTSGTSWNIFKGNNSTNTYWTFSPFADRTLKPDDIKLATSMVNWLATETHRAVFVVDIYSLPNSRTPRLIP